MFLDNILLNADNELNLLNNFFTYDTNEDNKLQETGFENEKEFILTIPASGVKKDAIDITIEDNILTVKFKREVEKYNNAVKKERKSYNYNKSFKLSNNTNKDTITAELKNGLLSVIIEKSNDKKIKKIELNKKGE